ncbi:glycosyltransferase family 4 protein [Cytophaga hutchinsonii]|uniref:A-glycosyltransferase-related protein, glycosyltransferase family 4 protein n=1 Tax=Cytophaga hutchinsonii (strain ATCC 33406 / DSM 1761 / CIP 103989 / NBRC 15051 / NCIMB 9469 / D465) TaxID=269798 RepID=A0A6N4SPA4_CYTH3|nr:glycosyltransferase family 4 protein [Cytophaga hutchinsonii]ABG58151.1 a-glycosyltransferase-related protein, glycosyltransferase family 4 protein [Cytophaga hutchinsonii ATCC 33406]SFX14705.1 Glycosyl transferases group 1 [Cytophaga hutchinsonii ATCC 33406]
MKKSKVICVHIGARAHYLLPKAIEASGQLDMLITDTWIGSGCTRYLLTLLPVRALRSLAGRYSKDISSQKVRSFGFFFLLLEFYLRFKHTYGWALIMKRDRQFQLRAVNKMHESVQANCVFGISYTALECFKIARQKGMKTILFQVDPGIEEELIVSDLLNTYASVTSWEPAPEVYWERWKQECSLADRIMVNSEWSKTGLIKHGIPAHKISVISLPFIVEKKHAAFSRVYPAAFSAERPLRCLFLGTLTVRKGIHLVIQAAKELYGLPIEFICVGRSEISDDFSTQANIVHHGLVTREETDMYYRQADVFLFPTFSDGFGLTQLESMAWQLPVIATTHCGDVVQHGKNGWIIEPVTSKELAAVLKNILSDPDLLRMCAGNCLNTVSAFNTEKFTADIASIL